MCPKGKGDLTMSNVKWIKLSTQMFEDEKIRLIEQMPEADTILIIWVKLLSQAGKTNANGYIYLSENIPYTDEMLATIFNRPLGTVRMALEVFKQFDMIEIDDESFINISNWDKHQSVQGLDKIRQQNRERVARHREKKKIESGNADVTLPCNGDVTDKELDLELELELDKDIKDIVPYRDIVDYLNEKCNRDFKASTQKTKDMIKARWKEGFTLDDFKLVIDIKSNQWLTDEKMNAFLRPLTLFGTKFESYLNEGRTNNATNIRGHGRDHAKGQQEYADGVNF